MHAKDPNKSHQSARGLLVCKKTEMQPYMSDAEGHIQI